MKNERKINIILSLIVLIQPFLDLYWVYNSVNMDVFGFKISTIIRYLSFAILGIIFLYKTKLKEDKKQIIIYFTLLLVYIIGQIFNARGFTPYLGDTFKFSLIQELFYISRYVTVFFLIYFVYKYKLKDKCFEKTICLYSLIVSLSLVFSNIFYLAFCSYKDAIITFNIFDWFTKDIGFMFAASRGFFYSSIVITTLLMITPYIYYLFLKNNKFKYLMILIFNVIALLMVGTKGCAFGVTIEIILMLFLYLFFTLIKKEIKFNIKSLFTLILVIVFGTILLQHSPSIQRMNITNNLKEEISSNDKNTNDNITLPDNNDNVIDNNDSDNVIDNNEDIDLSRYKNFAHIYTIEDKELRKKVIIKYISENKSTFNISETLMNRYPYNLDYEFWADVILYEKPVNKMENRYMQEKIFKRVKELNNNKFDDFFGLTYSRTSSIFNLEKDFLYQYYSLGILGIIVLLMPIVLPLIICMIYMVIKREKLTFENTCLCLGLSLLLCVSYYSGNMIDNFGIMIVYAYIMGYLVSRVFGKKINKKNKFSIIMPTYNDEKTIISSLDSVLKQKYDNWELFIVNDGSTDETEKVVKNYINENNKYNIKYIYQKNQDQLNAIKNVISKISGDYVFILHSDDLLGSDSVLEKSNELFNDYDYDALISDLYIMNNDEKIVGSTHIPTYKVSDKNLAICLLWMGRNTFIDVGMFKKDVFVNQVKNNYLIWNTPFWLNYEDGTSILNVEKVDYNFIKYRVFEGNYINNEIGKLNVINGELRTATRLMKYYNIPIYKYQYIIYRIFNKLRLNDIYVPLYQKKETVDKEEVIDFILNKRYNNDYSKYIFLNSIHNFYKYNNKRSITIKNIDEKEFIYLGSDVRKFNNDMLNNKLSNLYINILNEMNEGFSEIKTTKKDYAKVLNIVKFLCIYPHVKITIEKKIKR